MKPPPTHRPRRAPLTENALVSRLTHGLPSRADVIAGPGDDCAVVRPAGRTGQDWLLKGDPVIEGVHFEANAKPQDVAHKALGRVLSDLAAMGGEPLWVVVDLVLRGPHDAPWAHLAYAGLARMARRTGVAIVGGDTSRGPARELHVFAVGGVPKGKAVLRSGARAGDGLYVTGRLGGSLAGRHLRFEPRLAEGAWLRAKGWATAMMDVSDGIATDLPRLMAASGTGARLRQADLPVSAAARLAARTDGQPAWRHALCDGEDFELLFTVRGKQAEAFERAWQSRFRLPCTRIGTVTRAQGMIEIEDETGKVGIQKARGYEHFL
jgi:thiamine-monophosphate kinase